MRSTRATDGPARPPDCAAAAGPGSPYSPSLCHFALRKSGEVGVATMHFAQSFFSRFRMLVMPSAWWSVLCRHVKWLVFKVVWCIPTQSVRGFAVFVSRAFLNCCLSNNLSGWCHGGCCHFSGRWPRHQYSQFHIILRWQFAVIMNKALQGSLWVVIAICIFLLPENEIARHRTYSCSHYLRANTVTYVILLQWALKTAEMSFWCKWSLKDILPNEV